MVSPYLLRRRRSLEEAVAIRAVQPAPELDAAARKAVLRALTPLRLSHLSPPRQRDPSTEASPGHVPAEAFRSG